MSECVYSNIKITIGISTLEQFKTYIFTVWAIDATKINFDPSFLVVRKSCIRILESRSHSSRELGPAHFRTLSVVSANVHCFDDF